jgi:hypothetical protein
MALRPRGHWDRLEFSNLPLHSENSTTEFPECRNVKDNEVRKLDKELMSVPFLQDVPSSKFKDST